MKKLLMGTNTKMTKTIADTTSFLSHLQELTNDISRDELTLFVIPSYTTLSDARKTIKGKQILLGAQNIGWAESGQFTGEISPLMLKEIGIDIVMIGHSERRHVFLETDNMENKKVKCALEHGFTSLLCVGETAEEKIDGIANEVLRSQIIIGFKDIPASYAPKIMVAYEPVWAIGTSGMPASGDYAEEKHKVIKDALADVFGEVATQVPVLYGGSVNPENANDFIKQVHVDGLFVGRSAWDADKFNKLIRQVLPLWNAKRS